MLCTASDGPGERAVVAPVAAGEQVACLSSLEWCTCIFVCRLVWSSADCARDIRASVSYHHRSSSPARSGCSRAGGGHRATGEE